MHQKNIEMLATRLIQLGCKPSIEIQIAAHACLHLPQFDLLHVDDHGEENCHVMVHCCKGEQGIYDALYYTMVLKKRPAIPEGMEELDSRMAAIDWPRVVTAKNDGTGYVIEQLVPVAPLLEQLSAVDLNGMIHYRYWCGTPLETLVPNLVFLKSQYELQQRFYITPNQVPISFEEAYRFLQSRWMEKQFQAERKLLLKKNRTSSGTGLGKKLLIKRKNIIS